MLIKRIVIKLEITMRFLTGLILLFLASTNAFADHHALNLEAGGPRVEAEITSIQLGEDVSIITAEGNSDEYGRFYVTYRLAYNRDGSGGSYTVQGRGYVDAATFFSGSGAGMWVRDGHLIRMAGVESISDGTQNLDFIVIDPLNRTLTDDYYALSN
jgi:hypothetical protein